ncbi:hypothetical protein ACH4D5_15315 [Streptomyces sp. NPDC018029]|uniref:hypothetical protein n=1 Tax=Streptomyces sp. NPDC018029 TaxID=3365032 RepID=UPI0037BDE42D
MSRLTTQDVFDRICRSVEERYAESAPLCGCASRSPATFCDGAERTLNDLVIRATHSERGCLDRTTAWLHVAGHLREEATAGQGHDWTMIAVWLLTPRLRRASYVLSRRTGAERADVCSGLLKGVLEAARTVEEADAAEIEEHLVDAAFSAGWRTGRRNSKETLVTGVVEWSAEPDAAVLDSLTFALGDVVHVRAMSGALAQQAQGERLGALAYRMGLLAHMRTIRQQRRQGRLRGEFRHKRTDPSQQPCLFELRRPDDEALE